MLVAQLCPTLCDPLDCSPPGSSVHGVLQARILEWVAIVFSRGSSWSSDWTLHCRQILYCLCTREALWKVALGLIWPQPLSEWGRPHGVQLPSLCPTRTLILLSHPDCLPVVTPSQKKMTVSPHVRAMTAGPISFSSLFLQKGLEQCIYST